MLMVRHTGFEPVTLGSEDRCSIQLSQWRIYYNINVKLKKNQEQNNIFSLVILFTN